MTAIDDLWDRDYKTTQAYNYKKREEAFVTRTTEEEAQKNADQLIESEEMAKQKAEKKDAKKKRQKEKKKAEKVIDNNEQNKTSSNSAASLDSNVSTKASNTETVDENEGETLEWFDQEEQIDDEILDINAAFVKVSVKQNKTIAPNKTSVPKPEKVSPALELHSLAKKTNSSQTLYVKRSQGYEFLKEKCAKITNVNHFRSIRNFEKSFREHFLVINNVFLYWHDNQENLLKKSMSMLMPKFMKPKITKSQSDTAETLGMQSCYLAVNNNDFVRAIDFLSQAIFLAPEDVRHFLNRSYCHLRLGQYTLALNDAQFAKKRSQLIEHRAKAVAREGQALCGLRQYHEAEKCFEELLKLEDGNEWILTELILVRALQLTNMGFSKMDALKALQQCSAVIDAVTLLTSGSISSPELESSINKSEIENYDGDEIYFSDDESSSTIFLSKVVSAITDESCYLENFRSQPSSSKTLHYTNSSERILKSSASLESFPCSNGTKPNSNIQWEPMTNFKSVPGTSKTQIQKPIVSESSSIWVGSIDKSITDHKLRELFGVFGKINYIRRFSDDRNYVFIDFNSKKAASKALNNMNDFEINGIKLPVKPALGFSGKK